MCPHTYANPSYLWDVLAYRRADQVVHLLRDAHSGAANLGGGGGNGEFTYQGCREAGVEVEAKAEVGGEAVVTGEGMD